MWPHICRNLVPAQTVNGLILSLQSYSQRKLDLGQSCLKQSKILLSLMAHMIAEQGTNVDPRWSLLSETHAECKGLKEQGEGLCCLYS